MTGKQAVCAHLWRADACAQGVPVARTAGGPYVYESNGDSQEYARVQGIRRRQGTHRSRHQEGDHKRRGTTKEEDFPFLFGSM